MRVILIGKKEATKSFQNRPEPWMAKASVQGRILRVFWKDLFAYLCTD